MARPLHAALLPACLAMAQATTWAGEPAIDPGLLALSEHLRECTPATATQPHPLMRGFTIEHAVVGAEGGRCGYTQSMPGGMRMVCAFDETVRAAFAGELRETATTGRMSGSSREAQPAWMAACEIETTTGQRTPMAR